MSIKKVKAYECTDGKVFSSWEEARRHEHKLTIDARVEKVESLVVIQHEFWPDEFKKLVLDGHITIHLSIMEVSPL